MCHHALQTPSSHSEGGDDEWHVVFNRYVIEIVGEVVLTAVVDLIVTASYNNDVTAESSVSDDLSHRR